MEIFKCCGKCNDEAWKRYESYKVFFIKNFRALCIKGIYVNGREWDSVKFIFHRGEKFDVQ
jgi:hypothetical protein